MPAYEYLCNDCGLRFEARQKMSDAAIELCSGCGGRVKRLISGGAGVISKGGSGGFPEIGCGTGAPCCGQGGGCPNQEFCQN